MEDRDKYTFKAIENLVCTSINDNKDYKEIEVSPYKFYELKKNIPSVLAAARNITLYILHSRYGYSYSFLSRYSNMTKESVMRCVRKCRQRVGFHNLYSKVIKDIDNNLKKKYGE